MTGTGTQTQTTGVTTIALLVLRTGELKNYFPDTCSYLDICLAIKIVPSVNSDQTEKVCLLKLWLIWN